MFALGVIFANMNRGFGNREGSSSCNGINEWNTARSESSATFAYVQLDIYQRTGTVQRKQR